MDGFAAVTRGVKHLVEGFGEVLQQVKAVGHLDRGGGPWPGPVGIGAGPLAGDHAAPGMGLAPAGDGRGLPIRHEGQRSPPFKVAQHGAIGLALLVGPVVDAESPGGGTRRNRQTTPQPQHGVATEGPAQGTAPSHPRPAPQRQGDMCQPVDPSLRAPRPGGDQRCEPRGNHAAGAATIGAEALPPMQGAHDVPWSPGEIGHRADIATMDTPRRKPTDRTVDQGLRRRHLPRQLGGGVVHLPGVAVELGCIGKHAGQKCHGNHRLHCEIRKHRRSILIRAWWLWRKSSPTVAQSPNKLTMPSGARFCLGFIRCDMTTDDPVFTQ